MTLALGHCDICHKAVVHEESKRPLCAECTVSLNELYLKIRALLRDYPERGLGIKEVSRILEVEEREVRYLLDSGRFSLVEEWKKTL